MNLNVFYYLKVLYCKFIDFISIHSAFESHKVANYQVQLHEMHDSVHCTNITSQVRPEIMNVQSNFIQFNNQTDNNARKKTTTKM